MPINGRVNRTYLIMARFGMVWFPNSKTPFYLKKKKNSSNHLLMRRLFMLAFQRENNGGGVSGCSQAVQAAQAAFWGTRDSSRPFSSQSLSKKVDLYLPVSQGDC